MADNFSAKDALGATLSFAAKLVGGVLVMRNIVVDESNAALVGQKAMAASVPVVLASDQTAVPVNQAASATGTQTSVAGSASDGTILASNASRKGASVFNDSTVALYLLLASGTSSTSNFSVKLGAGDYFEVPARYTGVIKGIWASATGNACVTEFT